MASIPYMKALCDSDRTSKLEGIISANNPEQQFYIKKLLGYTFAIEYKTGMKNLTVDALLRQQDVETISNVLLLLLSKPMSAILKTLREENETLTNFLELHSWIRSRDMTIDVEEKDGILFYKNRFYVGKDSVLKRPLLEEFHNSPIAVHGGVKQTLT